MDRGDNRYRHGMIIVKNLYKTYHEEDKELVVLQDLNLEVLPQKRIGIVGASGVGKSTLLHILGGLDFPTRGSVLVEQQDIYGLTETKRSLLRNRFFGFIFQFYHLLPELNVLENVALPAWIAGLPRKGGEAMAAESLSRVGLKDRVRFLPSRLSGGEQQRVALARALCLKPKVILADEPTGNLDQETGREVLRYLLEVVEETKGSLVLVTHNTEVTRNLDEVFELKDGKLNQI